MRILTGSTGASHITAADDGALYAGIVGPDSYVLDIGQKFEATVLSAVSIRLGDGDGILQGRHFRTDPGNYDTVSIEDNTAGTNRNDIIGVRYTASSGIESMVWQVVKGTATSGTAEDPAYSVGDLLSGGNTAFMPMYRVKLTDASVSAIEPMYEVLPAIPVLKRKLVGLNLIQEADVSEGWINSSGVLQSDSGYRTSGYIPVSPGEEVTVQLWRDAVGSKLWVGICYFNASKGYISGSYKSSYETVASLHHAIRYTTPEGAAYVRVSYLWGDGYRAKLERGDIATEWSRSPYDIDALSAQLAQTETKLVQTEAKLTQAEAKLALIGKNLLEDTDLVVGWIDTDGTLNGDSSYRTSGYIPVTPGEHLIAQLWRSAASDKPWIGFTCFSESKEYLSEHRTTAYGIAGEVYHSICLSVPSGVAYIRVSYAYASGYKVKLERDNITDM